jgi:glycosyltransferase involved in cell wall biosynthesis
MNKTKVLIYTDCYIYGGSERLMSFLMRNSVIKTQYDLILSYRKHKIYEQGLKKEYNGLETINFLHPVSILSNNTLFNQINSSNISSILKGLLKSPFYLFHKLGFYFVYNLISQLKMLSDVNPDILHINNGGYPGARSCNTMVLAAKIFGCKNILYQVNNMSQPSKNILEKIGDKFINKNVRYFLTASRQAREKLSFERSFTPQKILQLTNTVINETPSLTREAVLKSLSIDGDVFIIAVVAFLSKRKGQVYLLSALNLIRLNYPLIYRNIKILLVGNGEDETSLKNFVREKGIDENVFFLGYQSQSINYINACDLFVLPSIYGEDMPLVILTAMSKGKTILATDYAGIREEIEDGISGILVSPDTDTLALELSKKIIELYTNKETKYGKEALARFNRLFSTEVYGHSINNIYSDLLKSGS